MERNNTSIVARLLIRTIFEKKLRTFLIIFSIILSTILIFCSMTISDTLISVYTEQIKKQVGSADIIVAEGEKEEYKYFSMQPAMSVADKAEYIVGGVIGHGYYKGDHGEKTIDLYGIDLNDLQTFNPITYAAKPSDEIFVGDKVIIGSALAKENGLEKGDKLTLQIEDRTYAFTIYAISHPVGPFTNDTQSLQAVMPKDTYASIVGAENDDVRIICLKLKDQQEKGAVIEELSELYPNYQVREAVSLEDLNQQVGPLALSFKMVAVVVFLLSGFIIFSSFQVIILERLPMIGTLRSIGSTKRVTKKILLLESLFYGLVGGLLGCLLGIGILFFLSKMMSPSWMEAKVTCSFLDVIISLAAAIILVLISSIAPVLKVSKLSIKDILLDSDSTGATKTPSRVQFFIGLILLFLRLVLPSVVPMQMKMLITVFCLVITVIGVTLLIPYLLTIFVKLFEKINLTSFGNEGLLATMNLRRDKSVQNSVILLTIGISSLLMVTIVTSNVLNGMTEVFTKISNFHVYTSPKQGDENLEKELYSIPQITDVYSFYTALGVFVPDKNDEISVIEGIDPDKYLDYMNITFDDGKDTLAQLKTGRNILVSSVVRKKMNLSKGDRLTLNMETGNQKYTVIGFFDSTIYGSNYAIVSAENLKKDMKMTNYSFMYIKCKGNLQKVTEQIKKQFPDRFKDVYTIDELIENDRQKNGMIFYLLKAFSLLSMLIGLFGIVNNRIVNFMERRRWLAMMKSVGMSKRQVLKMLFIEAFTSGLIGGLIGVLTGVSMVLLIPHLMLAMGLVYTIEFSFSSLLLYLLMGVFIMIVASIGPALKSSKLTIIEGIKYE